MWKALESVSSTARKNKQTNNKLRLQNPTKEVNNAFECSDQTITPALTPKRWSRENFEFQSAWPMKQASVPTISQMKKQTNISTNQTT